MKEKIDRETERDLIYKYQKTRDSIYLQQLIDAHTLYVQSVANRQYNIFGKLVELEDLIQEGKIGLMEAIKKFDLSKK